MGRRHGLEDTAVHNYCDVDMTSKGHPRSKVMIGKGSLHRNSYLMLIVTTGNSRCLTRRCFTMSDCSRSTLGSQKISSNTTYILSMSRSRSRSRISKFFKGRGLGIMSIAIYTLYVSGRYYSLVFM